MYKKIYYKDKFIAFVSADVKDDQLESFKTVTLGQTTSNQAFKKITVAVTEIEIKALLQDFIDDSSTNNFMLGEEHFDKSFEYFKKNLHYIEAAGGFIEKENKFLCIHRLGRWDLPKGKLEKGETIQEAAVRECEEECGIKKLSIIKPLQSTFHLYPYKNSYAIKQSYWFYMQSTYDKALKAQTEEKIDEVRWFTREEISNVVLKDTYYTVSDVIREALPDVA